MLIRTLSAATRRGCADATGYALDMTQKEQWKMEQLERDVKRLEADNAKLGSRICEANKRLDEQWKKVESAMTANIRLEQDLDAARKELRHAHTAVRLYKAAAQVMQEAGYEANKLKEA